MINHVKIAYDPLSKEHVLIVKNRVTVILEDGKNTMKLITANGTYTLNFEFYNLNYLKAMIFSEQLANNNVRQIRIRVNSYSDINTDLVSNSSYYSKNYIWTALPKKVHEYIHAFFLENFLRKSTWKSLDHTDFRIEKVSYKFQYRKDNTFSFGNKVFTELYYEINTTDSYGKLKSFNNLTLVSPTEVLVLKFNSKELEIPAYNLPITVYSTNLSSVNKLYLNSYIHKI